MPRHGRKEDVVAAAVALFSRKGYHGTTVRDIALESGMLSGSLYAHIESKEDLLYEIVLGAAERFMAAVGVALDSRQPAAAKLRGAMKGHLRVMAESREAAAIFMHEWKALSPERRAVIAEKRRNYEGAFAAIIAEGVAVGDFRPVDEKFARLLVLSAVNWLYQWYDPSGPLGPDAVADRFADLIVHGLVSHKGGGES
ncbi:MAG TPA: TetR/AcrR family transcriptional regulator [Symbiobacteriaceae bacterium]|nr:TetR/AcrR family transcriptional regulator [Symbiobacteriaceae bacterium]